MEPVQTLASRLANLLQVDEGSSEQVADRAIGAVLVCLRSYDEGQVNGQLADNRCRQRYAPAAGKGTPGSPLRLWRLVWNRALRPDKGSAWCE
ncbi:MAG: hypothetical protein AMXMBFR61_09740 [Fimbriimonadales bacterium]